MSSRVSQSTASPGILAQRHALDARRYFERHGYLPLPELPAANPAVGLVVVVPALAEPDVMETLESVAAATRPRCAVELLLVVNGPDDAGPEVRRINAQALKDAGLWAEAQKDRRFRCHVLDYRNLAAGHAGVGLARKLGMDTALSRLTSSDDARGVIVALDADCHVASNYLTAIEDYFRHEPAAVAATIYFEHRINDISTQMRQAIIDYELHLRCYKQGLQAAGSPYASHTVGSAFAVRSEIYAQEGGMNRRAAGEDFYFINKMLKRGHVGEIGITTVFPSARVSRRVPFGTGAAMSRAGSEIQATYAPAVYRELQSIQRALDLLVRADEPVPSSYRPFLESMGFDPWLDKTRANVASAASLAVQLTRWLDGFRSMKFINWLTETCHPRVRVAEAACEILEWNDLSPADDSQGMLEQFRRLDRQQA